MCHRVRESTAGSLRGSHPSIDVAESRNCGHIALCARTSQPVLALIETVAGLLRLREVESAGIERRQSRA